ncbi:hypothetical protein LINPERHAP1_LOCUS13291, partial [Linum perenne]
MNGIWLIKPKESPSIPPISIHNTSSSLHRPADERRRRQDGWMNVGRKKENNSLDFPDLNLMG